MLRPAGKCKKSNAALGGKMQKNAVFIGENDIFYLEKMKQFGNSESVSNASDWLTIIQRMVRDFSSEKTDGLNP